MVRRTRSQRRRTSRRGREKMRKRKKEPNRQYLAALVFTLTGIGLPTGYLLIYAISTDDEFEATGAAFATIAGSLWLTIAMSFYEGRWLNKGLMIPSWLFFTGVLVPSVLIGLIELTDEFTGDDEVKRDEWVSLCFVTSGIIFISQVVFNLFYICRSAVCQSLCGVSRSKCCRRRRSQSRPTGRRRARYSQRAVERRRYRSAPPGWGSRPRSRSTAELSYLREQWGRRRKMVRRTSYNQRSFSVGVTPTAGRRAYGRRIVSV